MSSKIYFDPQYIRNRKTFKKLFSEYYSPLCLFADKYISNMEVSKDIVQDVFIKLWERDMKISSKVTMKPFMYVTVRNACINYIRQKNREEKRILDYAVLNSDSLFEYNVMEEDVSYKLFKAVDQLSPRSKEAILLTVQEYSNQEIATKMKVSINTVKTLKQRSYQRLRQAVIATICFLLLCI